MIDLVCDNSSGSRMFYPCRFNSFSTSSVSGKDGCAPNLVTASAPQAQAYCTASSSDLPFNNPTAKPPMKASPAAVVSTTFTLKAGICFAPSLFTINAPFAPSVTMIFFAPRAISERPAASTDVKIADGFSRQQTEFSFVGQNVICSLLTIHPEL